MMLNVLEGLCVLLVSDTGSIIVLIFRPRRPLLSSSFSLSLLLLLLLLLVSCYYYGYSLLLLLLLC